ncbi:helix-turn-helix transcriptional regulator [Paenibacillus koleovorans]|uniref:helix-turn-helix transcriptional regulator n=1 Tax=Paenibacillus koleovorans TaxID=121608 RepID=UPI000FD7A4DB|nr:AraC family transcriptional regulator [Paenibacillus koleovorans]
MFLGNLNKLLPTVNFASRTAQSAGTDFGIRVIPDFQLFHVIHGKAVLRLGSKVYTILDGGAVFYGMDTAHQLKLLANTEFYSMHFRWDSPQPDPVHPAYQIRYLEPDQLAGVPSTHTVEIPGRGTVAIPNAFREPVLEPLFEKIVNEYIQEKPGYAFMLRGLLMELLTVWIRQLSEKDAKSDDWRLSKAMRALSEEPEQNWSVEELAKLCGYHPTYFTKLFRERFGVGPKHYLLENRTKVAKRMLLENKKLEEIAERLQYGSIHYFSTHFKKATGLTPSEFRQQGVPPGAEELEPK